MNALHRATVVCAALLAAGSAVAADLLITNARVFAGSDANDLTPLLHVAITEGRIESISARRPEAGDAVVIDARGQTLMPGLVDGHIHAFFDFPPLDAPATAPRRVQYPKSEAEVHAYVQGALKAKLGAFLDQGFTSLLSTIDPWPATVEMREQIARGDLRGPRVFASGGVFVGPAEYGLCAGNAWCAESFSAPTASADQGRESVRRYARSGVNQLVMVYNTEAKPVPLSSASAAAIIDEAHRHGLKIFLESPVDAKDVPQLAKWGIDGFLHPPAGSVDQDGALLKDAGARKLPVAITFGAVRERLRLGMQLPEADLKRYEIQRRNTLSLIASGGVPVFASDLGDKQGLQPREIIRIQSEALLDLGLTAPDVLRAATRDSARYLLGRQDLGTVEQGKIADLILIQGDPTRDLAALTKVQVVIKNGVVVADHRARHEPP
ncbi:MAG: amidohydrolase family protein [Pseudomonadota bacterium]|nr:amidohydrolase family protein [Pseudomonadota bacterium]